MYTKDFLDLDTTSIWNAVISLGFKRVGSATYQPSANPTLNVLGEVNLVQFLTGGALSWETNSFVKHDSYIPSLTPSYSLDMHGPSYNYPLISVSTGTQTNTIKFEAPISPVPPEMEQV